VCFQFESNSVQNQLGLLVAGLPNMQTKMVFAELALKHWYTILFGFRSYICSLHDPYYSPIAGLSLHIFSFQSTSDE
jgi:hypothetical protein